MEEMTYERLRACAMLSAASFSQPNWTEDHDAKERKGREGIDLQLTAAASHTLPPLHLRGLPITSSATSAEGSRGGSNPLGSPGRAEGQ